MGTQTQGVFPLPPLSRTGDARPTNGLMPDGTRTRGEARSALLAKLETANDRLRETWSREDIEEIHVQGLVARMKAGQRWAHQLFAKYRLANGDTAPIVEKVSKMLGTSLDLARGAIEVHRAASGTASNPQLLLEQAEQYLMRRWTENPALMYRSPIRRMVLDAQSEGVQVLDGAGVRASGLGDAGDGRGGASPGGD